MSHREQLEFFRQAINRTVRDSDSPRVLEIGSYDVNGSIRDFFTNVSQYIGVDLVEGPGVDVVVAPGELPESLGQFDIVVASEVFEHDSEWPETVRSAARRLVRGGVMITSCASTGRPEHGTPRTDPTQSPGTSRQDDWHYENLTEADLKKQLFDVGLTPSFTWFNRISSDLYTVSQKVGPGLNQIQPAVDISKFSILRKVTPLKLLARMPIILMLAVRLPPLLVDTIANKWWGFLRYIRKTD